ncbi:MAG: hypothetical protein R3B93_13590 [Bacteroidia bacterium]
MALETWAQLMPRVLLTGSIVNPENLFFLERLDQKSEKLKKLSAHPLQTKPDEYIRGMDLIILSVKPQFYLFGK